MYIETMKRLTIDNDDRFKERIEIGAGQASLIIAPTEQTYFNEFIVHATWTEGTYYPLAGYSTSHISLNYYNHCSYGLYTYKENTFHASAHWVNHLRMRYRIRFSVKYENNLIACEVENEEDTQTGSGCGS